MTVIFEARLEDGSRKLLTDKFMRDIQREVELHGGKSQRKRDKMVADLLSRFCFLNGYTSIDGIMYGINTPMRRANLICEA